jgi:tetratricopeptide (TPR) repeat protein
LWRYAQLYKIKKTIIYTVSILFCLNVKAQSLTELFDNKEYKKVIENYENTTDSKELYYLALSYYQLENDKLNISKMKQAIANGNTNPDCYHYISNSFTYLNQADSSIKYLKIGSEVYPTDIETWRLLASAHLNNKSIDEAISIYEKINTDFPSSHIGYMGLANHYAGLKSYSKALENYNSALKNCSKENSDYLSLLFNAGLCNQQNDNYNGAVTLFNELVLLDKTDFHAKGN